MFSNDPRGDRPGVLVVEAVAGSGEPLVSGRATPARFEVDRHSLASIDASRGERTEQTDSRCREHGKPLLALDELRRLVELALKLEDVFDDGLDIEWGWTENGPVLFQARPLDEGVDQAYLEKIKQEEISRLQQIAGSRHCVWVRHSLNDTLTHPTPLTWDIMRRFMSGSGGYGRLYRQMGYAPSRRVSEEGFLELIAGRLYADPDRLSALFCEGLPWRYDYEALRVDPALLERAPTTFDSEQTDARFFLRFPRTLFVLWRATRRLKRDAGDAARRFDQDILPEFLEYVERERQVDLGSVDLIVLLELLDRRRTRVLDEFGPESLRPGLFGGLAFTSLRNELIRLIGEGDGDRIARDLVVGLKSPISAAEEDTLFQLSRQEISIEEYLADHGHRAGGEMELATPRLREQSAAVVRMAEWLRQRKPLNPAEKRREAEQIRVTAESEMAEQLAAHGARVFHRPLIQRLALARQLLPYREVGKYYLMMGYELIRQVLETLADRYRLGQDIYFLRLDELRNVGAVNEELRSKISDRKKRWRAERRIATGDFVDSHEIEQLGVNWRRQVPAETVAGSALAGGVATGSVQIMDDPRSWSPMPAGSILVCSTVDPGFTPLLLSAAGMVVERGGLLSHGAIIARQLGIPAVVCPDARHLLHSAEKVVVDGDRGRILIQRQTT
jgi:pyruvate,water dikinase